MPAIPPPGGRPGAGAAWRKRLTRLLPVPALLLSAGAVAPLTASAGSCVNTSPPDVTGISPSSGPVTGGTNVTVNGDNFTKLSGVSFGSVPATSFTVVSCNQLVAVSPPGVLTVDVLVSSGAGTSAGTPADQFTYALTVPGTQPTVKTVSPSSGGAGGNTTVMVTGSGFNSVAGTPPSVQFGGVAATGVAVQSDSQLTATSPSQSSSGTVDVTVTTAGGTSNRNSGDQFTYFPQVTAVAPPTGGTNGGTSVTISGNGFANATSVSFGGVGVGFSVSSGTQITATSPAHDSAVAVDVQVVAAGLGSPLGVNDQFTYQQGFWLVSSGGVVTGQGAAQTFGNAPPNLSKPIVGIASTGSGNGYWLLGADGGVFANGPGGQFGDATFKGRPPGCPGSDPSCYKAIVTSQGGNGYWVLQDNGNIYGFGDVGNLVCCSGISGANSPFVAMAAFRRSSGVWALDRNGQVFTEGGAPYHGNMTTTTAAGIAGTADDGGYWIVDTNGNQGPQLGNATVYGNVGQSCSCITGIGGTRDGGGYWVPFSGGGAFNFGDASAVGSNPSGAVAIAVLP